MQIFCVWVCMRVLHCVPFFPEQPTSWPRTALSLSLCTAELNNQVHGLPSASLQSDYRITLKLLLLANRNTSRNILQAQTRLSCTHARTRTHAHTHTDTHTNPPTHPHTSWDGMAPLSLNFSLFPPPRTFHTNWPESPKLSPPAMVP